MCIIGGNGAVALHAASISNTQGKITGVNNVDVVAATVSNNDGAILSQQRLTIDTGANGFLANTQHGVLQGDQLDLIAPNFTNAGGSVIQTGASDTTLQVNGTFDNSDGVIASNGNNLTIDADGINNDRGLIKLAAAASGAVALAGLPPTLLTWALTNPAEATKIGLITVETAAAIKSGAITPSLVAEGVAAKAGQVGAKGGAVFATEADQAYFWSGLGRGGDKVAAELAATRGGTTLEQITKTRGIDLPTWDAANPASVQAWQNASRSYAEGASGNVRAVIGDSLRPGSIWETIELPALKANPNVTRIIQINPATGVETVIFSRGGL